MKLIPNLLHYNIVLISNRKLLLVRVYPMLQTVKLLQAKNEAERKWLDFLLYKRVMTYLTGILDAFCPQNLIVVAGIVAGSTFVSKRPEVLLKVFLKEFLASLALYHLFFIGCTFIVHHNSIPNWVEWIFHALGVIGLDNISSGATMNPAISGGAWISGSIDVWTFAVHLVAQIYASQFGFYSIKSIARLLSDDLAAAIQAPSFSHLSESTKVPYFGFEVGGNGQEVMHALIVEGALTFFLALIIFLSEKRIKSGLHRILAIALGLRVCIVFGGDITGANMNPMIAYSWLFYFSNGSTGILGAYYQKEYIMVYCVAPMIAAGFAALLVSMLSGSKEVVAEEIVNVKQECGDKKRAPAPAATGKGKARASSRGRGKAAEESEAEEETNTQEEDVLQEEPEPVVVKNASRARGRTASRGPSKKAAASPKPSPSPVRKRSTRGKK